MRHKSAAISRTILMHLIMAKLAETYRVINVPIREIKREIIESF
jgi:hypothetical protein